MTFKNQYLEKLPNNELQHLAEFVVSENYKHHSNNILPPDYQKNVRSIFAEEQNYQCDSEIFVSKNLMGEITGSIRVLKWNYKDALPIQKIFGIHPFHVIDNDTNGEIYHIGRFAISRETQTISLFKQLMVCAISPICTNKYNIGFAECDSKLLRVLQLLGIKAKVIGKPVNYLGSETIPICLPYKGLIEFYNKNKHLVLKSSDRAPQQYILPKSVVYSLTVINYS